MSLQYCTFDGCFLTGAFAPVEWRGSFFKQHIEMEADRMPEALGMLRMPCLDLSVSGENQIWLNQCTKDEIEILCVYSECLNLVCIDATDADTFLD